MLTSARLPVPMWPNGSPGPLAHGFVNCSGVVCDPWYGPCGGCYDQSAEKLIYNLEREHDDSKEHSFATADPFISTCEVALTGRRIKGQSELWYPPLS